MEEMHLLDEKTFMAEQVTGYSTANLFSLLTFSWLDPLLSLGYRKPLDLDDIPQVAQVDCADEAFDCMKQNWERIKIKSSMKTPSLFKCLTHSFWKTAVVNGCFAGLYTCASYVGPYLINDFVEFLGGDKSVLKEGYVLTGVFFGAKLVESLAQRHWFFSVQQMGLRIRAGLTALIYQKGLCLSNFSRQLHTSGEVINYMSVDVQRIGDFSQYLHDTWLLPVHISLSLLILYKNLGLASLSALGATVFSMIANLPFSRFQEKFQNKIMEAKDERMKATSEILKNMKILKLQAWEIRYLKKLEALRNVECSWLTRFLYTQSASLTLFWGAPVLVAVVAFSSCVLMGIPLTSGRVLSALATLRIMQEPIRNLPDLVSMLTQTRVSVNRIRTFLLEQELQSNAVDRSLNNTEEIAIEFKETAFSWDASAAIPTLTVADLQIRTGTRVAVCGMVGSGKSSLLSCILGEIPKLCGTIKVRGRLAYVAQSAWIQSGKVVDNILFGNKMQRVKYEDVLCACALTKDLEIFSHGDHTEIGERGINLSGGQKQRIQLARAIYQDADVYLLDDPFSAVDAHTGAHLFKECMLGALAAKTVIYVTHQVEFLPAADLVLVLQNGKIVQSGKYNDLQQDDTGFGNLIGAHNKALDTIDLMDRSDTHIAASSIQELQSVAQQDLDDSGMLRKVQNQDGDCSNLNSMEKIVHEEEREMGRVSISVYCSLMRAAYGGALVPFILLAQSLFQLLQIASNYWMALATPVTSTEDPIYSTSQVLLVYIGLSFGSALCVLMRTVLVATVTLKTAQIFFIRMLHSIFHAPMSFFDATPTGRILNRASTDQSALDLEVPLRLGGVAFSFIQLIGIVAVMSQIARPLVLLFIPIVSICIWIQRYYIASARELARLVGICKAPILQHFGESVSGVATIRGFDQQAQFMDKNLQLIDCYSRPLFHNLAAMEWLCFRLDLLTNFVFASSLLLVVSLPEGAVDPSVAGLAVTYGLNLNIIQSWVTWNLCNVENKIISVERIQQYTRIPSEAPLVIRHSNPEKGWPHNGTIDFHNLKVRYGLNMPFVLHGITCTFLGGKKIGVVGRTGSGKSTLVQALFRIVEPTTGTILIDGLDISKIGLHDLRSHLSIIPQDPTMFEGSVRTNLDPLDEHTELELWEALGKSQLGHVVLAKDQQLDAIVMENGDNWSVGQRQLVCLGRALLKRAPILVLDEATASVDTITDGVIQDTIRMEFADCTVITIAHRIPTVIDSDWVLVLNDGRIAEYDSPASLLEDNSSLFSQLVSEYRRRSNRSSDSKPKSMAKSEEGFHSLEISGVNPSENVNQENKFGQNL